MMIKLTVSIRCDVARAWGSRGRTKLDGSGQWRRGSVMLLERRTHGRVALPEVLCMTTVGLLAFPAHFALSEAKIETLFKQSPNILAW